ncbi:MAG: amidohydrolase family protein, partial [Desulfobacteraceae bacterium]|nr:amidohydrolase family protein [Desulfobacteraceae bacterium]
HVNYKSMIIDAHVHDFSLKIVANVTKKEEMAKILCLETKQAKERIGIANLEKRMKVCNIDSALLLPTAPASIVEQVNSKFIETIRGRKHLYTAGTLHPEFENIEKELRKLADNNIKAIKLCSFSQGFKLDSKKAFNLFNLIQKFNFKENYSFFVILDTFTLAHKYFDTDPENTTTPKLIQTIVKKFPGINFIAAHMAGLKAPFQNIKKHILKYDNLFLDTSNATHTLSQDEFVELLKTHGSERIIFGTDWPWFDFKKEYEIVKNLSDKAGFSKTQKEMIFGYNIHNLIR